PDRRDEEAALPQAGGGSEGARLGAQDDRQDRSDRLAPGEPVPGQRLDQTPGPFGEEAPAALALGPRDQPDRRGGRRRDRGRERRGEHEGPGAVYQEVAQRGRAGHESAGGPGGLPERP